MFNDITARVTDDITHPISTEEWWNVGTFAVHKQDSLEFSLGGTVSFLKSY